MDKIRPKIGLIVLTIKQEISPIKSESKEIMEDFAARAEKSLKNEEFDFIKISDFIDDACVAEEKINVLIREKIDCLIIMIGAWPSPSLAIDMIDKINKKIPVILWAIPSSIIESLVPTCQFHGAFDDMDIKHYFIYSEPESDAFIKKIREITKAGFAINKLNGMNMGLFGGRYMNMYTGTADPIQVKKIFGVEITHIDEFCLVDEAKKVSKKEIMEFANNLKNKYGKINVPEDVKDKSIRLYYAMKKLKNEYNLDFAGVKCMLEVQGSYCSHCLSVSQNLDEGFVISCEADINAAITMQILKLLSNSAPGFGDLFDFKLKENLLKICNCGVFATEFAKTPKEVIFNEQYKHLVPGPGTGMITSFICKPGKLTLARLGRIKGEYVMQISSGNAISMPSSEKTNGWEKLPHLFIKKESNPEYFLQNCRSNHIHWVYGEYEEELNHICNKLNIKNINC